MECSGDIDKSRLPLFFLKDKGGKRINCEQCSRQVFIGLGGGTFKCKYCGCLFYASNPRLSTWEYLGQDR